MCNLYSRRASRRSATCAMRDVTGKLPLFPGIFPDYSAPIVRNAPDGLRELRKARWGMPSPVFALKGRNSDPGVTNVRNVSSPHWRRWLGVESRCVVSLTSFAFYLRQSTQSSSSLHSDNICALQRKLARERSATSVMRR